MVKPLGRLQAPLPKIGQGSLRVGRLVKPHGLKGGIKLELYTDNPGLRFVPGAIFYLQVPQESEWFGQTITLTALRWFQQQPVGFFSEVSDRTRAESVIGAVLWIDAETVVAGAEENAWYDQDLVGLEVREIVAGGRMVLHGVVNRVEHLPAQDLLAVATPCGNTILVPFVTAIVPEVNVPAGFVRVTPPQGLFDVAETGAPVENLKKLPGGTVAN